MRGTRTRSCKKTQADLARLHEAAQALVAKGCKEEEQEQALGKSSSPTPGRPEEEERMDRTQRLEKENAELRRVAEEANQDSKALKERLEIFERAMDLSSGQGPGAADAAAGENENDLPNRVRAVHADLVLEAVNLRNEVAALKTRKGVTIAMIADLGGKREEQVLEKELDLLRQRKKSPRRKATTEEIGGKRSPPEPAAEGEPRTKKTSPEKENLPPPGARAADPVPDSTKLFGGQQPPDAV